VPRAGDDPLLGDSDPALGEAPCTGDDSRASEAAQLHNERAFRRLVQEALDYEALLQTKTLRYLQPLRQLYGTLRGRARTSSSGEAPPVDRATPSPEVAQAEYRMWVRCFDTIDDETRIELRARLAGLAQQPRISIVLPVHDPPRRFLREAIISVRRQLYRNWELCVVDDASEADYVAELLDRYAKLDHRIKVVHLPDNRHICAATNAALEMAGGEWVAFMDHDDVLPEHALAVVAEAIVGATTRGDPVGLLYSDEDKIDEHRQRHSPYFKPEFDRLLLLGQNFLTHFLVVRRDLVEAAGGMRLGFEGSQDWDLALRVTEALDDGEVVHLPHVLYHWRSHDDSTAAGLSAKPYAADAGRRAVADHLARVGLRGEVSTLASGHNRVTWALPEDPPLVSVVIPTRDGKYLRGCLDSLFERTDYPNLEVLVVDNGSSDPDLLAYLAGRDDVAVLRDERPFNYSMLNNEAVEQVTGEIVCLLNDDTEIVVGAWLTEMVSQLLQAHVGAVGAKLYYDDGTIQHAGVILGVGGVAGHLYRRTAGNSDGQMGRLRLAQNLSAVTAACMVTRRHVFEELGGFDALHLAVAFNDVDYCLRLRQAGWRVVWTPAAELVHHESVSRGSEKKRRTAFAAEERYMQERWGSVLRHDPAYNPNLSLVVENGSLAWPPRVSYR